MPQKRALDANGNLTAPRVLGPDGTPVGAPALLTPPPVVPGPRRLPPPGPPPTDSSGAQLGGILGDIGGGLLGGAMFGPGGALAGAVLGAGAGAFGGDLAKQKYDASSLPSPPPLNLSQATLRGFGYGAAPTAVGRAVSGMISGPLKPKPGSLNESVGRVNEEHGLGMSAGQINPESLGGRVGHVVDSAAKASLAGDVVSRGIRQRMTEAFRNAAAQGHDAVDEIGPVLGQIKQGGADVDMSAHQATARGILANDVIPKIQNLHSLALSADDQNILNTFTIMNQHGAVSPDLTQKTLAVVRRVIDRNGPVQSPALNAIERIVSTEPTVPFTDAADLRTALMRGGKTVDPDLPEASSRLSRFFTGELTDTMNRANPGWLDASRAYGQGMEGMRGPVGDLFGASAPEAQAASRVAARTPPGLQGELPPGVADVNPAQMVENLSAINEAVRRLPAAPGSGGRYFQIMRLLAIPAAVHAGGGTAMQMAGAAAGEEALSAFLVWAAHNPGVTRMLTDGLTQYGTVNGAQLGVRTLALVGSAYQNAKKNGMVGAEGQPVANPTLNPGIGANVQPDNRVNPASAGVPEDAALRMYIDTHQTDPGFAAFKKLHGGTDTATVTNDYVRMLQLNPDLKSKVLTAMGRQ